MLRLNSAFNCCVLRNSASYAVHGVYGRPWKVAAPCTDKSVADVFYGELNSGMCTLASKKSSQKSGVHTSSRQKTRLPQSQCHGHQDGVPRIKELGVQLLSR